MLRQHPRQRRLSDLGRTLCAQRSQVVGDVFNGQPGLSGVQGLNGELLINSGVNPNAGLAATAPPVTNIDLYPTWQATMRAHRFPALIVWGERDPAFIAAGAKAYLRDLPDAELHLLDAGHFAVEERASDILEIEVNPMLVLERGAVAVDALCLSRPMESGAGAPRPARPGPRPAR